VIVEVEVVNEVENEVVKKVEEEVVRIEVVNEVVT
jgi:hypothetical protein